MRTSLVVSLMSRERDVVDVARGTDRGPRGRRGHGRPAARRARGRRLSPRPASCAQRLARRGGDPEPALLPLDDGPGPARTLPEAVAAGMVRAIVDAVLAPERAVAPAR